MPADNNQRYDPLPPIPTYDEALASGSRSDAWHPTDERSQDETESQSLLASHETVTSSTSNGYRPPTVETDDEDSLWESESDSDGDEADEVRREMQELEVEESGGRSRTSIWGKRIGFSLFPRQWKWNWRWQLPRFRIQLPSGPDGDGEEDTPMTRSCAWPQFSGTLVFLVVARILAIFIVLGFLYLLFVSDFFTSMARRMQGGGMRYNPEEVRRFVQESIDGRRMRASVKHYSSYAHIAGTEGDYALAMDVESMFTRAGVDSVGVDEYFVYLNYPKADGRAVEIMDKDGVTPIWTAKLEEEETGGETVGRQTYAFHGHSKSGDVKGPLVYANYGSREDFKRLHDSGIDTKGAIALVRYYGTQGDRALKVKAAELAGFAGCIIYSDPAQDGFLRGDVYPKGPWRPADSVQRGAVSLMSWVVGDVLTPGWESKKGLPRMSKDATPGLVKIPSLPLAWRDAQVLLQHLSGFGEKVPRGWVGGVPDVGEWWSGNLSSPVVRLKNEQDEFDQQPIWNVYGKIEGIEQKAKSVMLGNHRDAWAFGATDPHTGTAVMIEVARIFGDLVSRGWRPLRTIEFMSWDGEEYNLVGSTEFVENNLDSLRQNAYAYINLDTVVAGNSFRAAGSPVFRRCLERALKRVWDPMLNNSLYDLWAQKQRELGGLGAGSDYVAFQDIAGTSSLDVEFGGDGMGFPYHSSYDNFDLVDRLLDPGWVYHNLLAQVVGLILLELADRPFLPFDMDHYGERLDRWVRDLQTWSENKGANQAGNAPFTLQPLREAVVEVRAAIREFSQVENQWDSIVLASGMESGSWESRRIETNERMSQFETNLLDLELGGGIPNRTQFKHVVFGPQLWSGYDEAFFPAIRDTVDAQDWDLANETVYKTAAILKNAAQQLIREY